MKNINIGPVIVFLALSALLSAGAACSSSATNAGSASSSSSACGNVGETCCYLETCNGDSCCYVGDAPDGGDVAVCIAANTAVTETDVGGLVCQSGQLQPCGHEGYQCCPDQHDECPGATLEQPLTCASGGSGNMECLACGAPYQPCCPGNQCALLTPDFPVYCGADGTCDSCGTPGYPCCPSTPACDVGTCIAGSCQ